MAVRAGLGVGCLGCRLASRLQLPARAGGHVSAVRWVGMVHASVQNSGALPLTHISRLGMPVEEKDPGARSITHLARMGMTPGWEAGQPPSHAAAFASLAKPQIRDPERPKRPPTAWIHFLAKFRSDNKDSQLKAKEVLIQAGSRWKSMTAIEKKPFEDAVAVERRKYQEAFKQYVDSGKKDAWTRDPAKPKRPMSPFFKFALEFRQKHSGLKMTEGTKQAKPAWEATPTTTKDAYNKQYAKEMEKYKVDMEAYKKSGKKEAWEKKVGIYAAKEKLALKKQKAKEANEKLKVKAKREKAKKTTAAAKKTVAAKKNTLQQGVGEPNTRSKVAIAKAKVFTEAKAEKAA